MEAYITLANMRKVTPINFTGKLLKKTGSYFEPFGNLNSEVWETNQNFDFSINGRTIKTKTVTIYK